MQLAQLPYKIGRGIHVYTSLYVRQQTPVLVYSTGRVGSMALHYGLEDHGVFAFQVHTLDPVKLVENKQPGTAVWVYNHVVKRGRPANIITLVRDPLAVMISDFFPKLRWIAGQEDAWERLSIADLCALFNTRYFEDGRHIDKLNWFDHEMKAALGIDIYQHPSPRETGYVTVEHAPYRLLLMKTETPDTAKARAIGQFVGVEGFNIPRRNEGEAKDYGEVYKHFKDTLTVRQAHLDLIYSSPYARHFYTDAEITAMMARWRGGTDLDSDLQSPSP